MVRACCLGLFYFVPKKISEKFTCNLIAFPEYFVLDRFSEKNIALSFFPVFGLNSVEPKIFYEFQEKLKTKTKNLNLIYGLFLLFKFRYGLCGNVVI